MSTDYEPRYWGIGPVEIPDITKLVDESCRDHLLWWIGERTKDGWISVIEGKAEVCFVDTDVDIEFVVPLRQLVKKSIHMYSEANMELSRLRDELMTCAELVGKALDVGSR